MYTIEELILKKAEKVKTEKDIKKLEDIKKITSVSDWMFRCNVRIVVDVLAFLDVPENKIKEYYFDLISPENFMTKRPIERI